MTRLRYIVMVVAGIALIAFMLQPVGVHRKTSVTHADLRGDLANFKHIYNSSLAAPGSNLRFAPYDSRRTSILGIASGWSAHNLDERDTVLMLSSAISDERTWHYCVPPSIVGKPWNKVGENEPIMLAIDAKGKVIGQLLKSGSIKNSLPFFTSSREEGRQFGLKSTPIDPFFKHDIVTFISRDGAR